MYNSPLFWFRMNAIRFFGTAIILLFVAGPLVTLVLDTLLWLKDDQASDIGAMLSWSRQLSLLAKSVVFSAAVALGDLLIGVIAASLFWTWNTKFNRILAIGLLSMIAVPPYMHAVAWRFAVDSLNGVTGSIGMPAFAFKGWAAAWWVQMMALAPVGAGLSLLGLFSVDTKLFEAGRIAQSDLNSFRRIVLPIAAPPLLAATGFIFLYTLVDYSVPSSFLLTTYALEVFAEFSANHSAARALLISLPFLALTLIVLILVLELLRQAAVRPVSVDAAWTCEPFWPRWFTQLQGFATALLLLQLIVPIISLGMLTESWSALAGAIRSASDEIVQTAWTAALAAIVGLPIAFFAALRICEAGRYWWLLVLLPIGIPAPLIGIGLISLWNNVATAVIYDGALILVLTYLARFLPIAALVFYAQLRRLDPMPVDAARILMPNRFRFWVQIYMPLMMRTCIAASLLMFVLALGELPASLLTIPAGTGTITIRIYNYMHYGATETVAGLCLVIPLLTIIYAIFLFGVAGSWRFFLPKIPGKKT